MARISIFIVLGLALVYAGLRWGMSPTQKSHVYYDGIGFEVIAHGAGQGLQPKNTLEAALMADQVGADIIEIDIHASLDGVLVLSHDETVDDMTDGTGFIREMPFSDLQQLDAATGFLPEKNSPLVGQGIKIPALAAVFDALPEARYIVEIKQPEPPIFQPLCDLIRDRGLTRQVLVGSFYTEPLESFREACPEVATSMSQGEVTKLVLLEKIGLSHLYDLPGVALQLPVASGGIEIITESFLAAMQSRGVRVQVWTINSLEEMQRLMAMGVDGIITDYPDRLIRLRENAAE